MFVYCWEELDVSLGIPGSGQLVLVPGHGHIRDKQEIVMLQVIATPIVENTSIQPKLNNRPQLYLVFKNTWNELIFNRFQQVLLMHSFSSVAGVSGPVSPSTEWHNIHFRGGATEQKRKNKGFKVCRLKNAEARVLMLGLALQWEFEGAISDSCLVTRGWIFSLQAVELLPLLLWEKQKALFSTWTVAWAATEVFMGLWTEWEKG